MRALSHTLGGAAAVAAVALLGNARLEASGHGDSKVAFGLEGTSGPPDSGPSIAVTSAERSFAQVARDGRLSAAGAAYDAPEFDEPGHWVPAVYPGNPDMRFGYFLHVNEWM